MSPNELLHEKREDILRVASKRGACGRTNQFQRGCLSRRVERLPALRQRIAALKTDSNAHHRTTVWQFTSPHAREKLSPIAQTHWIDHSRALPLQADATSTHTRQ